MTNIPFSINKIFWGLIFVLVDLNIVYFDLLPDIIGYLIVVSGLSQLQPHSSYFSKAKVFGILLALSSLVIVFINPPIPMEEFGISNITLFSLLTQTIHSILHLFLIIYAVQGLIVVAEKEEFFHLQESAKKGLRIYIIGTLAALAAMPFVWNADESKSFLIIIISALVTIIIEIIILVLLRRFRKRFMVL
ncbi:hypothetical protein [Bacillus sp. S/N-304-OC-R1]|uniref:hypothetical protein n=1 Tax=Bacillus sp. S/N-304-OC-R1 TaxID=2758034 RepID=UPI001C8D5146|nr:hypothetical protein [Bacillus sp. S/N-304-OC-R1]MBY0121845.1 hypothetical protein [Bacillus sp. S/N-304-OC-R1]